MSMIIFSSPKGGAGKTTLAAHVAAHFAASVDTLLVSVDSGADFGLHFGLDADGEGWSVEAGARSEVWAAARPVGARLRIAALSQEGAPTPGFEAIREAVAALSGFGPRLIIDAPHMPMACARALAGEGLLIYVLAAEAASMAAIAQAPDAAANDANFAYCLNLIDRRRSLCRDIEALAEDAFAEALLAKIGFDAHLPEAAARAKLAHEIEPAAQSAKDLLALARAIELRLGDAPAQTLPRTVGER